MRRGFTLVELLVVVTVLLILTGMTVYAVNFTLEGQRLSGATNQVQSIFLGAHSRAAYARKNIGVRLFLSDLQTDSGARTMVEGLAYVEAPDPVTTGTAVIGRTDTNGDGQLTSADQPNRAVGLGMGSLWYDLRQRGLIDRGSEIIFETPAGNKRRVTFDVDLLGPADNEQILRLLHPAPNLGDQYADGPIAYGSSSIGNYELHLAKTIIAGESVRLLPEGIVIDLANSQVPSLWVNNTGASHMDLMFRPSGATKTRPGGLGMIHLLLSPVHDAQLGQPADSPVWRNGINYSQGDWVKLSPDNGFWYQAQRDGQAGSGPSKWPTREGARISDGGVDWIAFEHGERKIVTIRTIMPSVEAHDVWQTKGQRVDPFRYAEGAD